MVRLFSLRLHCRVDDLYERSITSLLSDLLVLTRLGWAGQLVPFDFPFIGLVEYLFWVPSETSGGIPLSGRENVAWLGGWEGHEVAGIDLLSAIAKFHLQGRCAGFAVNGH